MLTVPFRTRMSRSPWAPNAPRATARNPKNAAILSAREFVMGANVREFVPECIFRPRARHTLRISAAVLTNKARVGSQAAMAPETTLITRVAMKVR